MAKASIQTGVPFTRRDITSCSAATAASKSAFSKLNMVKWVWDNPEDAAKLLVSTIWCQHAHICRADVKNPMLTLMPSDSVTKFWIRSPLRSTPSFARLATDAASGTHACTFGSFIGHLFGIGLSFT